MPTSVTAAAPLEPLRIERVLGTVALVLRGVNPRRGDAALVLVSMESQ